MERIRSLVKPQLVILLAGFVMMGLIAASIWTTQQVLERVIPLTQVSERIAVHLTYAHLALTQAPDSRQRASQIVNTSLDRAHALAVALRDNGMTELGFLDTTFAPQVRERATVLAARLSGLQLVTNELLAAQEDAASTAEWTARYDALYPALVDSHRALHSAVQETVAQERTNLFNYGVLLIAMVLVILVALISLWMHERRAQKSRTRALHDAVQTRTAELVVERNLLRTLIDNMPDLIYAKDRDSKFILANAAIAKSMGMAFPADLLGKTDYDFHAPAFAQEFRADELKLMEEGTALLDKQEQIIAPNGKVTRLSTVKVPLRDAQGNIIGVVGINRDVTDAYIRDAKFKDREAQYRRIVENAHEGIATTNARHEIVYVNERATEILGYPEEELLGQSPLLVVIARDLDAAQLRLMERREGKRGEGDYPIARKGGGTGWIHVIATPITDDFGKFAGALYMFTDITERKAAEEALLANEKLYRSLLEALPQSVCRKDRAGRFTYGNARFFQVMGDPARTLLGKTDYESNSRELADKYRRDDEHIMASGEPMEVVEENRAPNGELRIVRTIKTPVFDEDGQVSGVQVMFWDITEGRRQNEQIRKLSRAVEASSSSIVITDANGAIEYVNSAFCKITGYTADEAVGQNPRILKTGHTSEAEYEWLWQTIKNGQVWRGEFLNRKKNGALYWESASISPLMDESGKLTHFVAVKEDITARKQMEETLRERQELLARVLDTVEDGIYIADHTGKMTFANRATEHIVGATRQEIAASMYNDPRWKITKPDGSPVPEAEQPYVRVLASGEPVFDVEQCIQRPDGSHVIVSINAAPLHDADGQVIGEVASMTNVTERKRAEQELRRQKELLQAVFDHIPVMIGIFDSQHCYTLVNHEWEQTLGYTLDEMNRGDVFAEMYPDDVQRRQAQQFMFAPAPGWRDYRTIVRDGRTIDTSWAYTRLSDGKTIAFGQDITRRKEVDRLKNEFISTVSHELRTPLTSIRGSLGLIAGGVAGALPERAKSMIDIAYKNSERLVRLINDILDIEKIESGKMVFNLKPLDVMPLLEQVVETNHAYAEQYQVSFVITEAVPDARLYADADRMTQVMTNLLSNAAKYSFPGGQVEISVQRAAQSLRIAVRDQGPGIPPEFQSRIFQKFAQADSSDTRQKGGTGLGLSIVKAIVEKHGGVIGFESVPGVGSTFFFEMSEWMEIALPEPAVESAKPRILICEDDRDVALLLSMMLQQGGFETDVAYSAAQAQTLLGQRTYAALTLDLMLPDKDGVALIRELRQAEDTRNLPVVVVSAIAEQGRQQLNGDAISVADWLQKPIDQKHLVRAVMSAAQHGQDKPHILHIEDDADVVQVVAAILQDTAVVSAARDLAQAHALLAAHAYDLVILDPALPDGSGTELLPLLRRTTGQIPVVIFSAHDNDPQTLRQVSASLVKSRTSNQELVKTITQLIQNSKTDLRGVDV